MVEVFMFCAIFGGSVLVFQLVALFLGFAGDGATDALDGLDAADGLDGLDGADGFDDAHPDSTEGFKILSFRTVIAAVAFFGLGGLIADSTGAHELTSFLIAIASGIAAMWVVYKLYAILYSLSHDGTVQIANAVGCYGTVYLTIPGGESGPGKVLLNIQDRTMEYQALTPGDELKPGTRVVVTRVVTPTTVEVETALEKKE